MCTEYEFNKYEKSFSSSEPNSCDTQCYNVLDHQVNLPKISLIPALDGVFDISCSFSSDSGSDQSPSFSKSSWLSCPGESSWYSQPDPPNLSEDLPTNEHIPVYTSNRASSPSWTNLKRRQHFYSTIRRNNKAVAALSLPTVTVYNMRSIWSKLDCMATDMMERSVDLSMLSEVWEKKESTQHKEKLEELLELKNIKYSSTPRQGTKRGGGAAYTARGNKFNVTKLNIDIPKPLEVVWGLLRPKENLGGISKIIICSFYCPPNSRKKSALIDHLSLTINNLKITHPKANFIIAGDKNDLKETEIVAICPTFKQIVCKPTRKGKILTIVVTDLHHLYQEPTIIPPIPVDEGSTGCPSDHSGVLITPINNFSTKPGTKKSVSIRPIPQSSLDLFGQTFVHESFDFLLTGSSPTSLVELFQEHCSKLVEKFFPIKTATISSFDQPFFTEKLRAEEKDNENTGGLGSLRSTNS